VGGVGKMVVLILKEKGVAMYKARLWAIQVFKLATIKGNLQQTPLFSTPQSCVATQSHLKTGQSSIWTPDRLYTSSVQIATVLQKSSQQSRPLKCSLF